MDGRTDRQTNTLRQHAQCTVLDLLQDGVANSDYTTYWCHNCHRATIYNSAEYRRESVTIFFLPRDAMLV